MAFELYLQDAPIFENNDVSGVGDISIYLAGFLSDKDNGLLFLARWMNINADSL
jgi:hypothetical protein